MSQATFGTVAPPPAATASGRSGRPVSKWLAVVVLAVAAVVGSNTFSIRDRLLGSALPDPVAPATSRVTGDRAASGHPERTSLRSAQWWQTVTTMEGTGSAPSVPFSIDAQASEWRVTWSCAAGHLQVREPGRSQPLVDAPCPQGVGHANRTGATSLEVTADGPWRLEVAQRIDTPLVEPPLAAMTAPGTKVVGTGSLYKVDKVGAGRVTIYDQADGRSTVRLDDFWVTPSTSLQLRLSTAASPQTTRDYLSSESQLLSVLDVTAGSLNYTAPAGVDPPGFRSVVIWNPSENSVYAAARLEQAS